MIILDTDVFSLMELPDSPAYLRLRARIAQLDPPQQVVTTVITYEEQSRGRLATVNAARSAKALAQSYAHLRQHILNYRKIPILDLDEIAAETAARLQKMKLRVGTMDLRIAAIALTRNAMLLSRNLFVFRMFTVLKLFVFIFG
jgi:tRNA(fMet)-specific endonuclease VapC